MHRRQKRSLSSWPLAGPGTRWSAGTVGNCHSSSACICGPKRFEKQKNIYLLQILHKTCKVKQKQTGFEGKGHHLCNWSYFFIPLFEALSESVSGGNLMSLTLPSSLSLIFLPVMPCLLKTLFILVKHAGLLNPELKRQKFMKRYKLKRKLWALKENGAAPAWS